MKREKTLGYELIRESFHRKILPRFARKKFADVSKLFIFQM